MRGAMYGMAQKLRQQKNAKVQLYSHNCSDVNVRFSREARPSVIQSGGGRKPFIHWSDMCGKVIEIIQRRRRIVL